MAEPPPAPPEPPDPLEPFVESVPARLRPFVRRAAPVLRRIARLAAGTGARTVAAALVLAALALLLVLRQLEELLRAMHVPAVPGFGVTDLPHVGFNLPKETRPETVIETWDAYDASTGGPSPGRLARISLELDFLFIALYTVALGILLARSHRRLRVPDEPRWVLTTLGVAVPLPRTDRYTTYRRLAAMAFAALPLLALADASENAAGLVALKDCRGDCNDLVFLWLTGSAWLKWGLAFGVVVPLVVAALAGRHREGGFVATVVMLRIPILSVLFLWLLLFGPIGQQQFADVLRRWAVVDTSDAFFAASFAIWLGLLLLVISVRLRHLDTSDREPIRLKVLVGLGLAFVAAGFGFREWTEGGGGFFALGIVLLVIAALSYPIRGAVPPSVTDPRVGTTELPAILAAAPPTLIGLAAVQASVAELVYAYDPDYLWLVFIGAVLLLGGGILYVGGRAVDEGLGGPGRVLFLVASAVAAAVVAGLVLWDPVRWGNDLGALGAVCAFLLGAAVVGYLLQRVEYERLPPAFFFPFGIGRVPVLLVLAVAAVIAAFLDDGGYHDVRRDLTRAEGAAPLTVGEAWQRWIDSQAKLEDSGDRAAMPLVLVAAEGGGIRAAYWAAKVLDCALAGTDGSCGYDAPGEPGSLRSIFAVSGASGGSLGLATAVVGAHSGHRREDWIDTRLGDDYLAPTVAQTLFGDLPNGLLKHDLGPDRAEVLERAWESSWSDIDDNPLEKPFLSSYAGDDELPLMLLNGASVQDGCRVNTSPLNADIEELTDPGNRVRDCLSLDAFRFVPPFDRKKRTMREAGWTFGATHDVVDHLCPDEDIRVSTAALLSARFPYVSPSARLTRCKSKFATFVVDGGYFDNTGVTPLLELWARLAPRVAAHNAEPANTCIVPLFLHIDNHTRAPATSAARRRPFEALVPPAALGSSRSGNESRARQLAALTFRGRFEPYVGASARVDGTYKVVRYAYVYPRAQPGTSAPLGWALSKASIASLTQQLRENRPALDNVRRWFSPTLTCSRPAGERR